MCAGARKLAMGTRGARKKKALRKKVARVTENKYNENGKILGVEGLSKDGEH